MERELRDQHSMAVAQCSEVVDQALCFLKLAEWQTRLPLSEVEHTIVRCKGYLERVSYSIVDKSMAHFIHPYRRRLSINASQERPSLSGRLSSAIVDPSDGDEADDGDRSRQKRTQQIKDMVAALTEIKGMAKGVESAVATMLGEEWCTDYAEDADTLFVRKADAKAVLDLLTYLGILQDLLVAAGEGDANAFIPLLDNRRISMSMTFSPNNPLAVIHSVFVPTVDSYDVMVAMASKLTSVIYASDSPIVQQGTIGITMYFIADGNLSVTLQPATEGASPVVCDELKAGQFFGEIALLYNTQRKATVTTGGSHVHVYELSRCARDSDPPSTAPASALAPPPPFRPNVFLVRE